ncbi:MAG: hypothetical protein HYX41_07060 [Bdellovibrio sp.]|nr:hypothetical protein [Bdellovibrio sp.]
MGCFNFLEIKGGKRGDYSYIFILGRSFIALCSITFGLSGLAGNYDKLSQSQKAELNRGKQVGVFTDVAGSAWQQSMIYQMIKSTPEEAAAVFFDFERHPEYFPDLVSAQIARKIDKKTMEVNYQMEIPTIMFFPSFTENYTVRDVLSKEADGAYKVSWTMIRADSASRMEGEIVFEQVGSQTLMSYRTLVVPNRTGSGLVAGKVPGKAKAAGSAIVNRIEATRTSGTGLMAEELSALREALN